MTTLALYRPNTLVGMELRTALESVADPFEQFLAFSPVPEEVGNLIDIAGHAVRVQELSAQALADVDLVISCSDTFRSNLPLLTAIETDGTLKANIIIVAPDTPVDAGRALVPSVNLGARLEGLDETIVIPHAAVIVLSRLLHDLRDLGIESSSTTVLQPASIVGQDAMNEVFAQARSLLTMDGKLPTENIGFQTAFSTRPSQHGGAASLHRRQLQAVLANDHHDLLILQAGSFHGLGLSCHLRLSEQIDSESFGRALEALDTSWEALEQDTSTVGRAEAEHPGWIADLGQDGRSAWVWVAADNLTHAVAPAVAAAVSAWVAGRPDA